MNNLWLSRAFEIFRIRSNSNWRSWAMDWNSWSFKTGAMSYGSLSKEAHENLAIAMNKLGK